MESISTRESVSRTRKGLVKIKEQQLRISKKSDEIKKKLKKSKSDSSDTEEIPKENIN